MIDASLRAEVEAWLAQDPDPETREELAALRSAAEGGDAAATRSLEDRFSGRLHFGTAGLRAELGGGPMRMNRVVVAQTAAGLAAYLLSRGSAPTAVIGYDGRKNSDVFARDVAEVLEGAGVRATLLPRAMPTPVLAFGVRRFDASAGVMVTASHNPAPDNGLKVYLGGEDGGSQIVAPADAEIAAAIARAAETPITGVPRSSGYALAHEGIIDEYAAASASELGLPAAGTSNAAATPQLRLVYTALHGVGLETVQRLFSLARLPEPTVVAEQATPDGSFPTAPFPNPEEPGTLDLSIETARRVGADLIVANDPDADRLAIALPRGAGDAADWVRLTGNELGLLLGWSAAEEFAEAHRGLSTSGTLATSLVSSPALARVAEAWGLDYAETLTGFKWISRAPGLVFGYEEALGYLVNPGVVHDKDGVAAAARFVDLARRWHAQGHSAFDRLDLIAERIGGFASDQVSIRVTSLDEITGMMNGLRDAPPAEIAGRAVAARIDYLAGHDGFPPSDILRYDLADGSRVIARPSGTEPKLKLYIDACSEQGSGAERRAHADAVVSELATAASELVRRAAG